MNIWRHSLIRRLLLSHPHPLHHPIGLNTRPIYILTLSKLLARLKKRPRSFVCSTVNIANDGWEGVGILIRFICMLGSGSGMNTYYMCHMLL